MGLQTRNIIREVTYLMEKKHGIYAMIAAIAIQLILGVAYISSVFQDGIAQSIFNDNHADAALTFSLLIFAMTTGSAIGGKIAIKYSSRVAVAAGGIITGVGFLIASFVTSSVPWLLWLSYGIMGGMGMGFTYSTTIACAQKWYPHKKGLVTGLIVSALGFGGVVFTPVIGFFISVLGGVGVGEQRTFLVMGALFLVTTLIGSVFMKNPPAEYLAGFAAAKIASVMPANEHTPKQMLKTGRFYLIALTFLLAPMGGLMMIGFAQPIADARGLEEIASLGVMAIALFNSIGRLLWGKISDKLGRINTILVLLLGMATLSLFVNIAVGYWIFILLALIGFFYGGILSSFPSLTADMFGAKHMAANYGFVLLGFGVGALIASQIAGRYRNLALYDINLMFPAFVIASCCAVAGIIMMLVLKAANKKKKEK